MPSLILTNDALRVSLESKHLEIVRHDKDGLPDRVLVPLFDIERVVICGRPAVTIPVLQTFLKRDIPCYFITSHGRWLGTLSPEKNLQAERRIRQYACAGNRALALRIAVALVCAKIRNSRRVLQRLAANRQLSSDPQQTEAEKALARLQDLAGRAPSIDEARGYEGMAAAKYFARLGNFFPEQVPFLERSRRPPKNAANALLSWTYTILLGEVECAIRAHGLDAAIGFLHGLEHGRPSLALDLLEPLRPPVCDLLALNLLNHRVLKEDAFEMDSATGGWHLKESAHRDFFFAYEQAMTRKFTLRNDSPHTDFRRIIDDAVLTVINAIGGEQKIEFFNMP